jgi:hypothetical protein
MCGIYPSPNVIWMINSKKMRRKGGVVLLRKIINTYSSGVLVRIPDGKGLLGRSECIWEDSN